MSTAPVLYLTAGLPGAGKTTLARRIAEEWRILRLTPDEWMAPLFRDSDAEGRRDIIEGAHGLGRPSGSDQHPKSRITDAPHRSEERFAVRAVAESVGARFDLQYVVIDEADRRARAALR